MILLSSSLESYIILPPWILADPESTRYHKATWEGTMKQVRDVLALALAGAVAVGAVGIQSVHAQDKKEYVPQNVQRVMLKEGPLHGADGKMIHIERIAIPPGWVGGKHYHAGPVFVYVLKGNFSVEEEGKPRQTFKAGDLYEEPVGTPMQARVAETEGSVEILLIQVSKEGEPLMYVSE